MQPQSGESMSKVLDISSRRVRAALLAVLLLIAAQAVVLVSFYAVSNDSNEDIGANSWQETVPLNDLASVSDCGNCERATLEVHALIKTLERAVETLQEVAVNKIGTNNSLSSTVNPVDDANLDDPLDDAVVLAGFPTEAVSLKDLALCSPVLNIVMEGHWQCKKDPSCQLCRPHSKTRYDSLLAILDEPDTKAARLASYRDKFGQGSRKGGRKTLVVSAVNYGQLYLLLNWACSCEAHGIDPRTFSLIVPTDEESAAVLRRLGFFIVEPGTWTTKLKPPIGSSYLGKANSGPHADINNVLFLACIEVLVDLGHHVLLHDVDIVWNEDVRMYLTNASRRRDILGMHAPYYVMVLLLLQLCAKGLVFSESVAGRACYNHRNCHPLPQYAFF